MVANALAHGIAQHGMEPASYPMLRMVADIQDLVITAEIFPRSRTRLEKLAAVFSKQQMPLTGCQALKVTAGVKETGIINCKHLRRNISSPGQNLSGNRMVNTIRFNMDHGYVITRV